MKIDSTILFERPETAEERVQLDACLADARDNGRLAMLILLRRIEALSEHHAALARIRCNIVGEIH